jgi:hypothetical protein
MGCAEDMKYHPEAMSSIRKMDFLWVSSVVFISLVIVGLRNLEFCSLFDSDLSTLFVYLLKQLQAGIHGKKLRLKYLSV